MINCVSMDGELGKNEYFIENVIYNKLKTRFFTIDIRYFSRKEYESFLGNKVVVIGELSTFKIFNKITEKYESVFCINVKEIERVYDL